MGEIFVEEYTRVLSFLVEEMGFAQPLLETQGLVAEIVYVKDGLALELVLDIRDFVVSEYLSKWSEASQPGIWKISKKGKTVRTLLYDFSHPLESQDSELKECRQRWTELDKQYRRALQNRESQAVRKQLQMWAEYLALLLRKYGREIFARARERFGLPPEP
jgi:hypothetical protein